MKSVKIEADLKQFFLEQFPTPTSEVRELSEHFWIDISSHIDGYYDDTQKKQITQIACEKMKSSNLPLNEAWKMIILDFIHNANWNFKPLKKKPRIALSEKQKISKKLFKYIWAFFQSMIVLKIAVYYFGLESAENPDHTNPMWVWVFFSISVGSLILFAYRNRHDDDSDA